MKEKSYKASLNVILGWIESVARNGHFSYSVDIRSSLSSSGISPGIVQRMEEELKGKKYGYIVDVTENKMVIKW